MTIVLYALLFVGSAVIYGVVGVLIGRKIVHHQVKEGHNDVLVPVFLTVGVIYAVLLAFTVVAEWEFFDAARANTGEEAALLVPLYRQTRVMNDDKGGEMRHLIREYAEHVVHGWEGFQRGQRNTAAGADVNEIIAVFATMAPATKAREIVAAQFLTTFSQVILTRNKRYIHSAEALSPIMWVGILVGAAATIGLSFLLFMERGWPHVVSVAIMSGLIGMLLMMAALLSRPFQGPLAIDPAPFEQSLAVFDQVDRGQ
jgi:Protein of unknown function (DUF4239)